MSSLDRVLLKSSGLLRKKEPPPHPPEEGGLLFFRLIDAGLLHSWQNKNETKLW